MTRMVQLHRRQAATLTDGRCHACQALKLIIAVDAQLPPEGNATTLDGGSTGLYQAIAAARYLGNPLLVEFRSEAFVFALLIGEGRQHEAIAHRWPMQER